MKKKIKIVTTISVLVMVLAINAISIASSTGKINNVSLKSLLITQNATAEDGYSCSATSNCYGPFGRVDGTVSCNGTSSCTSGVEWVKCDGNKSECTD